MTSTPPGFWGGGSCSSFFLLFLRFPLDIVKYESYIVRAIGMRETTRALNWAACGALNAAAAGWSYWLWADDAEWMVRHAGVVNNGRGGCQHGGLGRRRNVLGTRRDGLRM